MSYSSSLSPLLLSQLRKLPTTPGVYIFKNAGQKQVLYIGKAKNLKNRVKSYFQPPVKLGPKTQKLIEHISSLETINVNSEIEALLLESRLIKKFKPPFNIASKDDKTPFYIHITKELWPKPVINHEPINAVAGPFLNKFTPHSILKNLRRITPYCLSRRPMRNPCLYSHLGLCNPCPGTPGASNLHYRRNISKLKNLLKGNFSRVQLQLQKEMAGYSHNQHYEHAQSIKNQLQHYQYLIEKPVSPEEYLQNPNLVEDQNIQALESLSQILKPYINSPLSRIEFYDNAHLAGTNATSAMVVAINGVINSQNYRHFKIKKSQTDSDIGMMAEILARRLKRTDWPQPDLIILDGGKPQLSILKNIDTKIPVIALAKQFETIIIPQNANFVEINPPKSDAGLRLIMHLRDEAHRFSRRLHHHLRAKIIA